MFCYIVSTFMVISCLSLSSSHAREKTINESAREIPLAYDVDVVVVGGTTRGVAAAVAAAEKGAKVFLAAPRPYLGEDVCGIYRLWLEKAEVPQTALAKAMFDSTAVFSGFTPGLPFNYSPSILPSSKHPDSKKRTRLMDGRFGSASEESVQYDGDVTLLADLGKPVGLAEVQLLVYQRNDDFAVGEITVETSRDNLSWSTPVKVANPQLGLGAFETTPIDLTAKISENARYVRVAVKRGPGCERVLLGELILRAPQSGDAKSTTGDARVRVTTPMRVKRASTLR